MPRQENILLVLTALFEVYFTIHFSLQGEEGYVYKYIWQNWLANIDGHASE
jgi:predicted membrane protein